MAYYIRISTIFSFSIFTVLISQASAQLSPDYQEDNTRLELIVDLFSKELYAAVIQETETVLDEIKRYAKTVDPDTWTELHYYKAISELRVHPRASEKEAIQFINRFSPDNRAHMARFELGSFYYNHRKYSDAIDIYQGLPEDVLNDEQLAEFNFKLGYCLFLKKSFHEAKVRFLNAKNYRNEFYYPSHYYAGMCYYFDGDYSGASKEFEIAGRLPEYQALVPFYLAQIYFSQEQYDLLITYVEQKLKDPGIQKQNELHQLLGQSYYVKQNYVKALGHLELYEKNTEKLTNEQFYQLAYTQYFTGNIAQAIENFRKVAAGTSAISQNANYYLADCYLKTGAKNAALYNFLAAAQMDYSPDIREEAIFNYAKLAIELGFHADAINKLQLIGKESRHYRETQELLSQVFLQSNDFEKVIEILTHLKELSTPLQKAYQQAHYAQGVRFFHEGKYDRAISYLRESLNTPVNKDLVTQALYWVAELQFKNGEYKESLEDLENYFYMAEVSKNLDEQCKPYMAYYLQAYNFIQLDDYSAAYSSFTNAYQRIEKESQDIRNTVIKNGIYTDAILRSADCGFKVRDYRNAVKGYQKIVQQGLDRTDYALYQLATIQGVTGKPYEKNITLEELITGFPESDYYPEALLALGDSYTSLGNVGKAAHNYKMLLNLGHASSGLKNDALLKLGLLNYNAGDLVTALKFYRQVFDNNPDPQDSQEALLAIEEIYIQDLGQTEEYLQFVETIPGKKLTDFQRDSISYRAAKIQYANENYEGAVKLFTGYIDNFQGGYYKIEAHYLRAECHSLLAKYSEALADYEFLAELGNNEYYESSISKTAAIYFNNEQDFPKALEYYSILENIARDPASKLDAARGAMSSAHRAGDADQIIHFSGILLKNDIITEQERAFAHYARGKVYMDRSAYEKAIADFQECIGLVDNAHAAESRYYIAEMYWRQGDTAAAEELAQKAYQESVAYPYWVGKNVILLSDIFLAKNDLLSARAAIEAIIENYKSDDNMLESAKSRLEHIINLQEQQNRIEDPAKQDTVVLEKNTLDND